MLSNVSAIVQTSILNDRNVHSSVKVEEYYSRKMLQLWPFKKVAEWQFRHASVGPNNWQPYLNSPQRKSHKHVNCIEIRKNCQTIHQKGRRNIWICFILVKCSVSKYRRQDSNWDKTIFTLCVSVTFKY